MNELAQGIYNRISLSVNISKGLSQMDQWLMKYTRLDNRPFSFDDHEMQIDIVNDTRARVVVQKCSQVGLSELSARKCLAIAAMTKGKHIQYVLPTRTFATKFSSSRLTPIINNSPMLKNMQSKTIKGTELKQIGSSFVHMGGTSGNATGAISVPASYVFQDEKDFCDQAVLGKYESRLKHAAEDEHGQKGIVSKFSTPTVPDYGINADFQESDQKHYTVRCQSCEHQFAPNYFKHVIIPGFERPIASLTPAEVKSGHLRVKDAYIECPSCKANVWEALCDPRRREWVPQKPGRIISGYQIHPWDVPKVNSIPSIIMQLGGYHLLSDYYNFTIGIPWVDAENSFLAKHLNSDPPAQWDPDGANNGYLMGVDIGKTAHITIGRLLPDGREEINYLERYTVSGNNDPLYQHLNNLIKKYKVRCTVIDAAPDFTTALEVIKACPLGTVYACEYTRNRGASLESITIPSDPKDAVDFVVKAYRTGVLQDFLRTHNTGLIHYPARLMSTAQVEMDEVADHLKNTKKIRVTTPEGNKEERFVNTGNDHYTHAINYMRIAGKIMGAHAGIGFSVAPMVSTFRQKGKETVTKLSNLV